MEIILIAKTCFQKGFIGIKKCVIKINENASVFRFTVHSPFFGSPARPFCICSSKITGGMKNGELFIYILLSKCAYSNFKPNVITSSDTEREFMLEFNASVARP